MSSPRAESTRVRRAVRWLLPAALLALTPKCVLCVAAYVGLGAAFGLGGPELCGRSADGVSATHFVIAALAGSGVLFAVSRIASRLVSPPKHK